MEQPTNPSDLLTHPIVKRAIRKKARELAQRPEFVGDDIGDIAGAIRVQLAPRLVKFSSRRGGLHALVACAMRSIGASLIKERYRDCRRVALNTWSFETPDECGNRRRAETITESEGAQRRGDVRPDPFDALITRRSIEQATASLDPDLVIVVRVLREDVPAIAARRLGISRRQLRALIAEIREHFVRHGFGR